MQITVYPTVFIALGGTGNTILQLFRKAVKQRVGTADLPFFRYLFIDTDVTSLKEADKGITGIAQKWVRTNVIDPSPDTIKRIRNPKDDNRKVYDELGLEDWFPPYVNDQLGQTNYSQGVGGRRVLSRLGFLASQNLTELWQTLSTFFDELYAQSNKLDGKKLEGIEPQYLDIRPHSTDKKVRFVIISSAGGGTGSGSFIELGFLLRRLAEEKRQGDVIDLIGHVLLARMEANPNQVRNSAALLTELDLYQVREGRTYEGHYLGLPGSPWKNKAGYKPFNCCYVLMPQQQGKVLDGDPFLALQHKVADYLVTDTVATFDDSVPAEHVKNPRFGPTGVEAFKGDFALNVAGLQTYGVARREWPAALVHRQLYSERVLSVAKTWSKPQESALQKVLVDIRALCGLPKDGTKVPPRKAKEDKLFERLCKAIDQSNSPQRLIELARDKAINEEKKTLIKGNLPTLASDLKSLFTEKRKDDPRAVSGILNANLEKNLNAKNEEGLPQLIASRLLEDALAIDAGPATVAEACKRLRTELKTESKYLANSLESLKPHLENEPDSLKQCYDFANESLAKAAMEAKKELLAKLEAWLLKAETRFRYLLDYVEAWSQTVNYEKGDLEGRSVLVPDSFMDKFRAQISDELDLSRLTTDAGGSANLSGELRSVFQQGLPDRDESGEPTLFFDDFPREQGKPDLRYFEGIESFIFREIQRLPKTPYDEQVFSALVADAKENHSGAIPNLMAEAEFLINADVGAHDFASSHFGGNPIHITKIYQAEQKETQVFLDKVREGEEWLRHWSNLGGIKKQDAHEVVTPYLSKHSVSIVAERCGLPSEFIVGYSPEQRQEWFEKDPFPAVVDKRIAIPPSGRAMERAKLLLTGSLAMRMWRYEGGKQKEHQLDFETTTSKGMKEHSTFRIPSGFSEAVEALARRKDIMDSVERIVRERLQNHEGKAAEQLGELLTILYDKNPESDTSKRESLDRLNLVDVPLERFRQAIFEFADHFEVRLPKSQHPFAELVKQGETVPGAQREAEHDGWFCRRCGHRQGSQEPPWTGPDAHCQSESCGYPRQSVAGVGA